MSQATSTPHAAPARRSLRTSTLEALRIEADAELPSAPARELMPSAFGAKYRELLRRANLTVQRFAEIYSQPIVLRPLRAVGFGGRGWEGSSPLAA
jgi:hypothetical protein